MPLGNRSDYEEAKYCGLFVEKGIELDVEVKEVALPSGFDFVATPLASSSTRRVPAAAHLQGHDAFARDALLTLDRSEWSGKLVGVTSLWLDLDASNDELRSDSIAALAAELAFARYIGVQAVLVTGLLGPGPPSACPNFARAVQQALRGSSCIRLWLRVPLFGDARSNDAAWLWWSQVRAICEYHPLLGVALEATEDSQAVGLAEMQRRWLAEPLRALIVPSSLYLQNMRGYPVLGKPLQALVSAAFKHKMQVIVKVAGSVGDLEVGLAGSQPVHTARQRDHPPPALASQARRPLAGPAAAAVAYLRPRAEYLSFLFQRLPALAGLDLMELPFHDRVQMPLQPLADDLESATYETFERDEPKYAHYREAIAQALSQLGASPAPSGPDFEAVPVKIFALGAGRGPLVAASLAAAHQTGIHVHVTALEKNPSALAVLRARARHSQWGEGVTVAAGDMRSWQAPHQADLLVPDEQPLAVPQHTLQRQARDAG